MVFLILESLGSTELFFILLMALVFFGPRKLPQMSRSLGQNLASFRRASEDFKRTWYREVNLEELSAGINDKPATPSTENSILDDQKAGQPLQPPTIQAVATDRVVPRQPTSGEPPPASDSVYPAPTRKRDWL